MLLVIDQSTGHSHKEVSDPVLIVESWETWFSKKEVQMLPLEAWRYGLWILDQGWGNGRVDARGGRTRQRGYQEPWPKGVREPKLLGKDEK